jgi:hypothetical protein
MAASAGTMASNPSAAADRIARGKERGEPAGFTITRE